MGAYSLCLMLLAVGQLGLPADSPEQQEMRAPALSTFQPPESLQASPPGGNSSFSAAPSYESPSVYGQNSAAPAVYGQNAPDTSASGQNAPTPAPSALMSSPAASNRSPAPLAFGTAGSATDLANTTDPEPNAAKSLLARTLRTSSQAAIDGTPVALEKIVKQTMYREQQLAAVRAYWRLSEMLAAFHYATQESHFFRDLPLPQVAYQQSLLTSQEASAKARAATAHLSVIQAQHELAKTAPSAVANGLPLPADEPFVGAYQTHFKVLNDRGVAPDRLRPIDQMLPATRASIQALAEAVFATGDALAATRQAYEAGQATLGEVLALHEQLRRQRRDFLSAVSTYNEQIAQYAFSVSLPASDTDQVVGMLIESPHATRSVLTSRNTDGGVRRASNEEEIGDWTQAEGSN